MSIQIDWRSSFQREIRQAEAARSAGKEGLARVCARRAAGHAIGEYLRRQGHAHPSPSAYGRLMILTQFPEIPTQAREIAAHFLERVTPEYRLPIEADLIAEARWLAETLLEQIE
jgi:hypothetical protein